MEDALKALARAAQSNAYSPYSGYSVGAAIEGEDGSMFAGSNVETSSYGLTISAERVAVAAAISAGVRRFRRLVVVTPSSPPAAPCGACRQVLAEFGVDIVVEAVGPEGSRRWELGDLLPDAFGVEDMRQ